MKVHFLTQGNCFEINERKYSYKAPAPIVLAASVTNEDDE